MVHRINPYLAGGASLLLLVASYAAPGFPWLVFVAFTPLLLLYSGTESVRDRAEFATITAVTLGITYLLIGWSNPDSPSWLPSFGYGLFIAVAFQLFALSDTYIPGRLRFLPLIIFFSAMEYAALSWNPDNALFLLGNTLGDFPSIQRWNAVTGLTGVSAWILLGNILIFRLFIRFRKQSPASVMIILVYSLIILILPGVLSLLMQAPGTAVTYEQVRREMTGANEFSEAERFGKTCAWVAVFLFVYSLVKLRITKK